MKETNIGYDKSITHKFIRFLRERRVSIRYQIYCDKFQHSLNKHLSSAEFVRSIESSRFKDDLLMHSFHWGKTKEGDFFWTRIYEQWNRTWLSEGIYG